MIGPIFLKGDLVNNFKEHLLNYRYHNIVHKGVSNFDCFDKNFTKKEVDIIVDSFVESDFPVVCRSGSKSSIPFFDYHIALRFDGEDNEVLVHELLVREPKLENCKKGILMACYMLMLDKRFSIERIVVPFSLIETSDFKEFKVEQDIDRKLTILSKRE